jgi:hypothetical protein
MNQRHLVALSLLLAVGIAPALAAPEPQSAVPRAFGKPVTQSHTPEWTEADSKALRERQEARQRMWDRKMKELTGSICTGC